MPHGMQDLSSPTRDQTCTPCIGSIESNHWITREVPQGFILVEGVCVHVCMCVFVARGRLISQR